MDGWLPESLKTSFDVSALRNPLAAYRSKAHRDDGVILSPQVFKDKSCEAFTSSHLFTSIFLSIFPPGASWYYFKSFLLGRSPRWKYGG